MTAGQRASYAYCPVLGCGKRLRVTPPPAKGAPRSRFPGHRHPAGGMCAGTREVVLGAHREHPCVRCALLPVAKPGDYDRPGHRVGVHSRPPEPRPIDKRSPAGNPHCVSHWREVLEERRRANSAGYRRRTHGISDDVAALVLAEQGGGCACGRPFARKYTPRTDHSHQVAREVCDHPENVACPRCYRGALHDACNVAIGRFSADQLEALAAYIRQPTTARIVAGPQPEDPTFAAGWRELVDARGGRRLDVLGDEPRSDTYRPGGGDPTMTDDDRMTQLDNIDRPWTADEATEAAELRARGAGRDG
jgi:hypothetical protein